MNELDVLTRVGPGTPMGEFIFHGWKFDAEGRCLDQPNLPEHQRAPDKVAETDYGILAGGYRAADAKNTYWRLANFLFPFWTQPPPCAFGAEAIARAWVPMDDTHTMLFAISTDTFVMAQGPRAARAPVPVIGMSFVDWRPVYADNVPKAVTA